MCVSVCGRGGRVRGNIGAHWRGGGGGFGWGFWQFLCVENGVPVPTICYDIRLYIILV